MVVIVGNLSVFSSRNLEPALFVQLSLYKSCTSYCHRIASINTYTQNQLATIPQAHLSDKRQRTDTTGSQIQRIRHDFKEDASFEAIVSVQKLASPYGL
ncbi:hypothetical protein SAMD00079811_09180 [Scytonema sp. HK-05]|nr:hypothetical protein SAMD00079811_09180 [Scytonema sp. HK-05]